MHSSDGHIAVHVICEIRTHKVVSFYSYVTKVYPNLDLASFSGSLARKKSKKKTKQNKTKQKKTQTNKQTNKKQEVRRSLVT